MATRALIGFIQGDAAGNIVLTSTYNHYDGYPDGLGKALNNHFNTPEKARAIANKGYISYVDPETGEIESKYDEPADETVLPEDFEEGMMKVAEMADSYGADYAYLWNFHDNDWVFAPMGRGIRGAAQELEQKWNQSGGDVFGPPLDESYESKWKKFLEEGSDNYNQGVARARIGANLTQAMFKLQDEPKEMLDAYRKSLANDIRLNGPLAYGDYSAEDFIEDYENFIADKMDI
jgi:hypothetical protein